jgi:hypothetical protein
MDAERQKKFQPFIDAAGVTVGELGLVEDQGQILVDSLILAVVGFDKKHTEATEADAKAFVERILNNLLATHKRKQAQTTDKHSARSRAIRKTQIDAISAEHGIKFSYLREEFRFVWPATPADESEADVPGQLPEPAKQEVEYGDKVGVIAFKYHLDHKNQISVELAMSFCSPKDTFDNLDGKEEALKHFMEGKTLKLDASHGALFGSLLGKPYPIAIEYAQNILQANGVVRRLKIDHSVSILMRSRSRYAIN